MRLEAGLRPDAPDTGRADPYRSCHRGPAPVRRVRRRFVGCSGQHLALDRSRQRLFARRPRLVAQKASTPSSIRSSSCAVKIKTSVLGTRARICRVASTPLISGIMQSSTATSGFVAAALRTASLPSAASATTSQPGCVQDPAKPSADYVVIVGNKDARHQRAALVRNFCQFALPA